MNTRITGKIIKFFNDKGFGFIKPDDKSLADTFLHIKHIESSGKFKKLAPNDIVEFDYTFEDNGPVAKNVKILNTIYNYKDYDNRGNR